ncbi:hypothetical protein EV421DRAFT_1852111 [Armillaria borealis]|uniref:Uncharacterized protein n=1 Tax=Armillaria borealis TaxID=47425 RepID=A0AA39IWI9_9AGAR|nr:hypothetical protein EV421DRAFT_1852111 [Armillaria borealis]
MLLCFPTHRLPSSHPHIHLPALMTGNKAYRTSVVRGAAIAVRDCFQSSNISWAIYSDLAWHLLCDSPTSGSWQLDVHITGDSATLAYATHRLADMDRRFSLTTQVIDNIATMLYYHNVLNDRSSFKKHECKISLVSGPAYEFFTVQDLPLLPIQVILYRSMETHSEMSVSRLKNAMAEVVAISEAYLRLPHLPSSVWSLTPAEWPVFLDKLAKITTVFPEAASLFACLHPSLPPPPIEPPGPLATGTQSTSVAKTSSLPTATTGRRQLSHSESILAVAHTLSLCVRQLGHECFVGGTGYAPWYIMGSPIIPTNHRVGFLVILRDGKSLGWLQHTLCRNGVLKATKGALQYSPLFNNGESKVWNFTFETIPLSMGLHPEESTGTYFDGISVINQNYLFFIMLSSVSSQGLPMKPKAYKYVSSALELLRRRKANIRAAFGDVSKLAELNKLVCAYAVAHPELRETFAAIGFDLSLAPTLPEIDLFQAAADAVRLLRNSGYPCAIFGSAACYLYGNQRLPNACIPSLDVDILVSSSAEAEVIKDTLVNQDPLHFYLKRARTPGATYQVLWYRQRLDIGDKDITRQSKVDIEALPLVPLEVLLLHKLQGWHDHSIAPEPHKRRKQTADIADIRCTLKIVLRSLTGAERSWARVALSFFQEEFQHLTMDRVKLFCSAFPDCRDNWYQLGFEVA